MAKTFQVSKKPSPPGTRKHRGTLVVSALSKTPITVTPLPLEGKTTKDKGKTTKDKEAPHPTPLVQAASTGGKRTRGRPRKALPPVYTGGSGTLPEAAQDAAPGGLEARKKGAKLQRTRPRRIDHGRLLEAERHSGKVPLAATRIVEQLSALLGRASVEAFRGKRNRPHVTLSKLEEQAIQEALVLFQLKVSLQRGGEVRRAVAS